MKKIPSRTYLLRELHFHGAMKNNKSSLVQICNINDQWSETWWTNSVMTWHHSPMAASKPCRPEKDGCSSNTSMIARLAVVGSLWAGPPPVFPVSLLNCWNSFFAVDWRFFHLSRTSCVDLIAWPIAFAGLAISSHRKIFFLFVTMLVSFAWRVSIFSSTFSVSTAISFWEKLGFRFLVLASTSKTSNIVLGLSLLFIVRALSVAQARICSTKFETGLTSVNRRLVNRGLNAYWKTPLIPPINYSWIKNFNLRLTANRRLT